MTDTTEHKYFDLSKGEDKEYGNPHRPQLAVYVEYPDDKEREDGEVAHVVLQLGAMHGQQMRWVEMTSEELRKLVVMLDEARALLSAVEHVVEA